MADASTPASPEPAALLEQALRLVHQISPHGAAVTEGFLESWLALEGVASPPPAVAALLANLRPDASLPTMTLAGLRDLVTSCNVAATAPDFSAAADADVRPLAAPLTHSQSAARHRACALDSLAVGSGRPDHNLPLSVVQARTSSILDSFLASAKSLEEILRAQTETVPHSYTLAGCVSASPPAPPDAAIGCVPPPHLLDGCGRDVSPSPPRRERAREARIRAEEARRVRARLNIQRTCLPEVPVHVQRTHVSWYQDMADTRRLARNARVRRRAMVWIALEPRRYILRRTELQDILRDGACPRPEPE